MLGKPVQKGKSCAQQSYIAGGVKHTRSGIGKLVGDVAWDNRLPDDLRLLRDANLVIRQHDTKGVLVVLAACCYRSSVQQRRRRGREDTGRLTAERAVGG